MADNGGAEARRNQYVIVEFSEIEPVACPCGTSRRALASETNRTCTLHMVEISKHARPHYHKALTEVYFFLEGEGHMELNGELHPVRPGMAVLMPPGTRHRAVIGDSPMKILNFVTPAFDLEDECFD